MMGYGIMQALKEVRGAFRLPTNNRCFSKAPNFLKQEFGKVERRRFFVRCGMKKKNRKHIWERPEIISTLSINDGCYYCHRKAGTWDHVVPQSKGGRDNVENLVPCCSSCNSRKGSKTLFEFRIHLRNNGLPGDFDTPDPRPIRGTLHGYSTDAQGGIETEFISDDGAMVTKEWIDRVYYNGNKP